VELRNFDIFYKFIGKNGGSKKIFFAGFNCKKKKKKWKNGKIQGSNLPDSERDIHYTT